MMFLLGAGVAAATYVFCKQKKAGTGESLVAAAVTGTGSVVVGGVVVGVMSVLFWPAVLLGAPLAAGYYLGKKSDKTPKALGPGS